MALDLLSNVPGWGFVLLSTILLLGIILILYLFKFIEVEGGPEIFTLLAKTFSIVPGGIWIITFLSNERTDAVNTIDLFSIWMPIAILFTVLMYVLAILSSPRSQ